MVEPLAGSVEVREALPEDAPALIRAIDAVNSETEFLGEPGARVPWADNARQRMREMRDKGTGVYFLARDGGEIIGFLGAFDGWYERTRGVIFIAHVGLRESYRGRGIGARLFAAIESWARKRGSRRLELRVSEANARGRALYQRCGFRPEGRIVDAAFRDGQFQADYWMGRVIGGETAPRWEMVEFPPDPRRRKLADLVVRPPSQEDAARLQAFERTLLTGSPIHLKLPSEISDLGETTKSLVESAADASRFGRVALADGQGRLQIVGHVSGWFQKGYRSAHDVMFALHVLPEFCGCGVGCKLADAVESWARGLGHRRLTTWTQAHNARGLRFAERLGFRQEVVSPNYAIIDGRVAAQVMLGKLLR